MFHFSQCIKVCRYLIDLIRYPAKRFLLFKIDNELIKYLVEILILFMVGKECVGDKYLESKRGDTENPRKTSTGLALIRCCMFTWISLLEVDDIVPHFN